MKVKRGRPVVEGAARVVTLEVRVSAAEKQCIRDAATRAGVTVSAFVRAEALRAAKGSPPSRTMAEALERLRLAVHPDVVPKTMSVREMARAVQTVPVRELTYEQE